MVKDAIDVCLSFDIVRKTAGNKNNARIFFSTHTIGLGGVQTDCAPLVVLITIDFKAQFSVPSTYLICQKLLRL